MERNIVFLGVPLATWLFGAAATAAAGYAYQQGRRDVAGEQAAALTAAQQAAAREARGRATSIQTQMMIEQMTPLLMLSIPIMGGIGAFLLWKKRQQEAE
jgi:hypothetical protein